LNRKQIEKNNSYEINFYNFNGALRLVGIGTNQQPAGGSSAGERYRGGNAS
jgi:hypothetical protein